jgi:hypothetical protein
MIDKHSRRKSSASTDAEAESAAPLPDFIPVPRQTARFDGWTPDRQRRFIDALADLGSVKAAAHAVNMTPEGAYLLRRHPEGESFRKAWEAALALGVQRLEDVAMERALHGVEVPVYHFGAVVGTRRVFNDRLLMFMLRNRAAKRFAADSLTNAGASTRSQLERLKREWRKEWEEEWNARQARQAQQAIESLNAKLTQMRERDLAARGLLLEDGTEIEDSAGAGASAGAENEASRENQP